MKDGHSSKKGRIFQNLIEYFCQLNVNLFVCGKCACKVVINGGLQLREECKSATQ